MEKREGNTLDEKIPRYVRHTQDINNYNQTCTRY